MDTLQQDAPVEDFLEHFGVKGMRWGVRKARDSSGSSNGGSSAPSKREVKKLAKADKKWEKSTYSTKGQIAVHNTMAKAVNAKIDAFNDQPRWKGVDLNKPGAKQDQYLREFNKMTETEYGKAVEKVFGKSPSGSLKATYNKDTQTIEIKRQEVKHADDDPKLTFRVKIEGGKIVGLELVSTELQHDDEEYEDVLVHFGVKGMKWGVRKKRGNDGPASADAERARAHAATVKKSGTKALSNKELQELVTRMNLEQQYGTLTAKAKKENPAAKFVKELVVQVGKEQAGKFAREQAAKQIASALAKKK